MWLCATEERGIRNITPQVLGEYWLEYIPAPWNEYGVGKANMSMGINPPFSGEYRNEKWKHSNGAWIRTEIWACLFPGYPELAVKYAYNDACVDHGVNEGTYAAVFVAALESEAFFETDIRKLIEKGLSFIPENCRVARSVKLAIDMYDAGKELKDARNEIVKDSEDLGWFQAPANVAYVVLGLLYGEGDFKKSMISAINCGDDTDCTGATIGSIMGIMHGSDFIPKDWAEYIGDKIVSVAVNLTYVEMPKSCTELTQRVCELVPACLKAYEIYAEYCDEESERVELPENIRGWRRVHDFDIPKTSLSYNIPDLIYAKGRVEFDKAEIAPGESIELKFIMKSTMPGPKEVQIDLILPEGWTADKKYLSLRLPNEKTEASVKISAGENVKNINKIYADIYSPGKLTNVVMPIIIHG